MCACFEGKLEQKGGSLTGAWGHLFVYILPPRPDRTHNMHFEPTPPPLTTTTCRLYFEAYGVAASRLLVDPQQAHRRSGPDSRLKMRDDIGVYRGDDRGDDRGADRGNAMRRQMRRQTKIDRRRQTDRHTDWKAPD